MRVMADICVVPIGVGVSVSEYVVVCERVLREAGLTVKLHAFGTNVEGEWEEVMNALKTCHQAMHEMGAPRIHTAIKLSTRVDKDQTIADKIASVQERL